MMTFFAQDDLNRLLAELFPNEKVKISSLDKGLLNQNLVVETKAEKLLLKIYRSEVGKQELQDMHRVMEFVDERGVPVPKLIMNTERSDRQIGLYRYLLGKNPVLYSKSILRIEAMGEMLGQIHKILDDYARIYKPEDVTPMQAEIHKREEKVKKIQVLIEKAKQQELPHIKELIGILEERVSRLESQDWDFASFDQLPHHFVHGDFHTANILFSGNHLAGVLDWEKAGWGGHAFEIMRSIIFNCRRTAKSLNWQNVETYVKAYKQHQSLTSAECELAFPFVFSKMMFGTWTEEEYLKGRTDVWENVLRRHEINAYLFKNQQAFTKRFAELFSK